MEKKERNIIAKSILDSKCREDVRKILNSVSFTSGNFSTTSSNANIANYWLFRNELYDVFSKVNFSKVYYTTQDIDDINAKASQWIPSTTTNYYQVVVNTVKWSDSVEELPEGAESKGTKSDAVLIVDNLGNWYEETTKDEETEEETTLYYQVIVGTVKWSDSTTELPDGATVKGYKIEVKELTIDLLGQWYQEVIVASKSIQSLTLSPKTIATSYAYKRQNICQEDLDDLNDSGEYDDFLNWMTWELRRHTEDFIVSNIIGGPLSQDISSSKYERFVIGETDDNFTYTNEQEQTSDEDFSYITVENVQDICDNVIKKNIKWLIIHPLDYRALLNESNAYNDYNLASLLGVDFIYQTNLAERGKVICLDPTSYFIKVKNEINIAYPIYENNQTSLQYEINGGGILANPKCSSMLYGSLMTY